MAAVTINVPYNSLRSTTKDRTSNRLADAISKERAKGKFQKKTRRGRNAAY